MNFVRFFIFIPSSLNRGDGKWLIVMDASLINVLTLHKSALYTSAIFNSFDTSTNTVSVAKYGLVIGLVSGKTLWDIGGHM